MPVISPVKVIGPLRKQQRALLDGIDTNTHSFAGIPLCRRGNGCDKGRRTEEPEPDNTAHTRLTGTRDEMERLIQFEDTSFT